MIAMSLTELAQAVGGTVHDAAGAAEVVVRGPAFVDSRQVEPDGLFVAVPGEHVDGHDYARGAVTAGAAAVLGTRPTGVPTVVVDDSVLALGRLARHVRDRLPDTTVLALTGSQGKTGTKDYLAQLLATAGPTVATAGNFNNEIGVPLTILRATPDTSYLVVEMGARGLGHIGYLCDIARPSIAAVLNVGSAHLGEFGTRERIAQAKGEILEALPADGVAVINADDDLTAAMAPRTRARVLRFGLAPDADLTWYDEERDDLDRPSADFALRTEQPEQPERRIRQRLQQSGGFQLHNAAAALAMAVAAGMELSAAVSALGDVVATSPWRMEVHERSDTTVVLNDAYNANPAAMIAALSSLSSIGRRRARRTVAVLGEMRELGPGAAAAHAEVGAHAAGAGIDVLVVVGEQARAIADGARAVPGWDGVAIVTASREEAVRWVGENVSPGDVVLVKASRGVGLEHVAQALMEQGSNPR